MAFNRETVTENLPTANQAVIDDVGEMQFTKSIRNEAQTRRFSILPTDAGWEVREERNGEVVKRKHCSDWHRVEIARRSIAMELETLRHQGWAEEFPN